MSEAPTFLEYIGFLSLMGGGFALLIWTSLCISDGAEALKEIVRLKRHLKQLEDDIYKLDQSKIRLDYRLIELEEKKHAKRNKAVK